MSDHPRNAESEAEQPQMYEAIWPPEQIDALFVDLESGAEVRHVQVRTSVPEQRPQDAQTTLSEAQRMLHRGTARAIQIQYLFDGQVWCDTLMVLPDGIRIVRTVLPSYDDQ
ncbi:MAG: hypothetical protein R3E01_25720 [Pirellulaceae bacterium]